MIFLLGGNITVEILITNDELDTYEELDKSAEYYPLLSSTLSGTAKAKIPDVIKLLRETTSLAVNNSTLGITAQMILSKFGTSEYFRMLDKLIPCLNDMYVKYNAHMRRESQNPYSYDYYYSTGEER